MPVAQTQGGALVPTQHVREPGIGALAWPAEASPCATHPDDPMLRLRSPMQDRLQVTPVCPEQHLSPADPHGVGRSARRGCG
jgi:hypothetical protein